MRAPDVDELDWRHLLCDGCRATLAALLYDGTPLCIDCADALVERQLAIEISPGLRELLPPVFEQR